MSSTTHPLFERIEAITPRLNKYANRHACQHVTADDLYQLAVVEIITNCKQTDNDTYMLRLADWRMRDFANHERSYSVRISAVDIEPEDDEDGFQIRDITNEPEAEFVNREMHRRIQNLLRGMKPEYVTIIELLSDGNNDYDIAAVVGTSRQNVEYHIRKIRDIFQTAGLTPAFAMA